VARRVFLHVGTMKSGTSYLRSLWWQNQRALAARGLLLPGRGKSDHFHAACQVARRQEVLERQTPDEARAWESLLEQTAATDGDALIGQDHFSRATPEQAADALRRLGEVSEEVHVLLTARDLGRQLGSAWQQDVKEGSPETLAAFWERADAEGADGDFWAHHDVPAILERWSQGLPDEQVHLVVLPVPGTAPHEWLWHRVCEVTGIDPTGLEEEAARSNESLPAPQIELLRQVWEAMPPQHRTLDTVRFVKGYFTRQILAVSGGDRIALTPAMHAWARQRAEAMVADLRGRPWHVVGDLADLLPGEEPLPGRDPATVGAGEVAEAAVQSLVAQLLRSHEQRDRIRALRQEVRRLRES
jgi:hypothetical protein